MGRTSNQLAIVALSAGAMLVAPACKGGTSEVLEPPDAAVGGGAAGGGAAGPTIPVGDPGTVQSSLTGLPDGEPTCCEREWVVRMLQYHPGVHAPRRMYFSACDADSAEPNFFVSLSVGVNAEHPEEDPSSGVILRTVLDAATGTLQPTADARRFPECVWMHGIATSADCSTIAALCRRRYGDADFDFDSLATHSDVDWMTQPDCAPHEMWLYEWTNGDIQTEPQKYVVHRAVGTEWDYGNNYLRLGENDDTYGISIKARVYGGDTCHEADAFLVMDRSDHTLTPRGWSWACGTGHTLFNRPAYNPATREYAVMCGTDGSEQGSPLGGLWMHHELGEGYEFHTVNYEGIRIKGGAGALLPQADGGFLGVIVGIDGEVTAQPDIPLEPPTSIGLVRFDSVGAQVGDITWVVQDPAAYLSYPQLAVLGEDRYLLGYGRMYEPGRADEMTDDAYRIPLSYHLLEIDGAGNRLTEPQTLNGVGWGEQDQMVPLGDGRVAWAYIPDPALVHVNDPPDCNSPELQLSVYLATE